MECSCAVDVYSDDYETVACFTKGTRKARKEHQCRECSRTIEPGEQYNYSKYVFDGSWWNDKACTDCQSAIDKFFPNGGYSELWMDIAEEISNSEGEIPESCIADLSTSARNKLCDMLDEFFMSEVTDTK